MNKKNVALYVEFFAKQPLKYIRDLEKEVREGKTGLQDNPAEVLQAYNILKKRKRRKRCK